jgi:hypothetical protein
MIKFEDLPDDLIAECCLWLCANDVYTLMQSNNLFKQRMKRIVTSLHSIQLVKCPKTPKPFPGDPCTCAVLSNWIFQFQNLMHLSVEQGPSRFNIILSPTGLPSRLISLNFGWHYTSDDLLDYLPHQSLTSLQTKGCWGSMPLAMMENLPRKLVFLKRMNLECLPVHPADYPPGLTLLDVTCYESYGDAQMCCLPPSLTHLQLHSSLPSFVTCNGLSKLPSTITFLNIGDCLGPRCIASLPRGLRHLTMSHDNMTIEELTCLPMNLTHLDLTLTNFDENIDPSSNCYLPSSIIDLNLSGVGNVPIGLLKNLPVALQFLAIADLPYPLDMCNMLPNLKELTIGDTYDQSSVSSATFPLMPNLTVLKMNSENGAHCSIIPSLPRTLDKICIASTRDSIKIARSVFNGYCITVDGGTLVIRQPRHKDLDPASLYYSKNHPE